MVEWLNPRAVNRGASPEQWPHIDFENAKVAIVPPAHGVDADAAHLRGFSIHTGRSHLGTSRQRPEFRARDYLRARYAHLTQSALSSVKMISESMEKWRETDLPVPG
jgi:hypothetical protein